MQGLTRRRGAGVTATGGADSLLGALRAVVGPARLYVGAEIPARHLQDAAHLAVCAPLALVRPATTAEVAQVLAACNAHGRAVVVQGGLTGLAGGAHPLDGEVILSLDRLTAIEAVDPVGRTMTVQAGATLQSVQQAAEAAGLFYPVDLGSRGSCTIGGNAATNAGGVQVLRYGMTRRQILGMEVALADGRVLTSLNRMMKNNTGYDWKEFFVGSEGTLGVITRLVLSLQPIPRQVQTAFCAAADLDAAFALQQRLDTHFPGTLLTYEGMWRSYLEVTRPALKGPVPLAEIPEIALLIEVSEPHGTEAGEVLSAVLVGALEDGLISDAVVAQSLSDRERLWQWREVNSEFGQLQPEGLHFDVSLPQPAMAEAIDAWQTAVAAGQPGGVLAIFGHLGDGNLHLAMFPPAGAVLNRDLAAAIYAVVAQAG